MDNIIDIFYYESMIESAIEDRKIIESIIESNCAIRSLEENSEELAIYEANIFETITNGISMLFEKVVDFIKGLIEKITGKLLFSTNHKLIEQCNEKIKSLSREERDKFKLVNIDIRKSIERNISWALDNRQKMYRYLRFVITGTTHFLTRPTDPKTVIPDDQLEKFKEGINQFYTEIEELSDVNKMKQEAASIDYSDIRNILESYSKSEEGLKKLKYQLKDTSDRMKSHQREMNNYVKMNREQIIRKYNQSQLVKYRDIVQLVTNAVIRLCKFELNMTILMFRNEENILRRFLTETPDVEVNPSYRMIEQHD